MAPNPLHPTFNKRLRRLSPAGELDRYARKKRLVA